MNDTTLEIASYDNRVIKVDLNFAYDAEARIREISFVNKQTAPELCSTFNIAYAKLARHFGSLMYEMGLAEIAVKKRKAVLTLDYIPSEMEKRKLAKGNEDIREAFYYTDEQYVKAKEALCALEAAKELVYIKMNALRMAFEATKSILKEQQMPSANLMSNVPSGEGIVNTLPVEVPATYLKQEPTEPVKYRGGWTKPKY